MQFNQDNHRGNSLVELRMRDLYRIVRERLEYVRPNSDLDAVTQNICVEVEKAMGIFPNLPDRAGERGELHRTAHGDFRLVPGDDPLPPEWLGPIDPAKPHLTVTGKPGEPWKPEVTNRFDELQPRDYVESVFAAGPGQVTLLLARRPDLHPAKRITYTRGEVVTHPDWNGSTALIERFEYSGGQWYARVSAQMPVAGDGMRKNNVWSIDTLQKVRP